MHLCPHCNQPGISNFRKLCLGPALPATCKSCGKKVGVPNVAMVAVLPIFIGAICGAFVDGWLVDAALLAAGFVIGAAIQWLWIPLVPR